LMGFKTLPLGHKIGFIAALTTLIGGVWPLATAVDFPLAAWGWPGLLTALSAIVAAAALLLVPEPRAKGWIAAVAMGVAAVAALVLFARVPVAPMTWGAPLAVAASLVGFVSVLVGNTAHMPWKEPTSRA
jgi:hypothetical protein